MTVGGGGGTMARPAAAALSALPGTSVLADASHAQRRAADPKTSAWVGASAGSGKTKVLVDRVLNLLLDGTRPERILCVTFTRAAAAEMANRIAGRLSRWATGTEADLVDDLSTLTGSPPAAPVIARARRLFAQVLDVPGGLRMATIHAFCQSVLRRFPLEAGVAPHFQVMDERDAAEAMLAARDRVLNRARGDDPQAGQAIARALAVVTGAVYEDAFPDLIEELSAHRGRLRRMLAHHGGLDGLVAAVAARLGVAVGETPAAVVRAACAESAFAGPALRAAVDALLGGSKTDGERGQILAAWLAAEPGERGTTFGTYTSAYLTQGGTVRKTLMTKKPATAAPAAAAALAVEAERLVRVLDRQRAATVAEATGALLTLGTALLDTYQRYKDARALLDYDDLIETTRRLLAVDGQAGWVLFKLDGGLDHLLVDEAQDTSADQWGIALALTQEFFAGQGRQEDTRRTVFVVGDRKQSIYSFQGAAPDRFDTTRAFLRDRVEGVGASWRDIPLNWSFRSTAAVLTAVDAVFARPEAGDGVLAAGSVDRHVPIRAGHAGLVEIWEPVDPMPVDTPEPWAPPVIRVDVEDPQTRLARLIARRIDAMVGRGDGRPGEELESRGRSIRPGDVMVLVRRRSRFVEDLVRALKGLGVPVAGADRMVLDEQMAVMDLLALGRVLLLPEDDLTLATVLKSPLVGLTEDELFALAHPRGQTTLLWRALQAREGEDSPFGRAFDHLAGLRALTDHLRPFELFARVLGPLGGRRRLVARLGPDAEDAIDEFLALTLRFEASHPASLQGFLRWMETARAEVKRDLDQGFDAVRILTVHGAKGLQAPIVFLPDTLQAPVHSPKVLWTDRTGDDGGEGGEGEDEDGGEDEDDLMFWAPRREDEEEVCTRLRAAADRARDQEYRRLLYVAMTRAEDRLYVCGWNTRREAPAGCWYNLVRDGVAPEADAVDDPFLAGDLGAPSPTVLRLRSPQTAPLPTLDADGRTTLPLVPDLALPAWALEAPADEPRPPRPLAPSRPDGEEPPVRSPLGADDGARYRRGRLVHRLLQSLPDLPAAARPAAAGRYLDHAAGDLTAAARAALAEEVLAVLDHPAAQALFAPGSQAEVPIVGLVGERVVSGQVDRLAVDGQTVVIADYKTNRPPPARAEDVAPVYLRQMAAYRAALATIYPSRRIDCVLVWTDGPRVMPLPPDLLDAALPLANGAGLP